MIIAITGKIASGKSLAAKFLSSISDIPCFDVDALSKVYMAENSEYISDICAQYGAVQPFEYETFIKDNIFNIKPFQNEIEGFCKNKLQEHLNRLEEKYGYVIIELFHIPLKFLPNIDVIIHVDCSDDIRSKRMVARGYSVDKIRRMNEIHKEYTFQYNYLVDNSTESCYDMVTKLQSIWKTINS